MIWLLLGLFKIQVLVIIPSKNFRLDNLAYSLLGIMLLGFNWVYLEFLGSYRLWQGLLNPREKELRMKKKFFLIFFAVTFLYFFPYYLRSPGSKFTKSHCRGCWTSHTVRFTWWDPCSVSYYRYIWYWSQFNQDYSAASGKKHCICLLQFYSQARRKILRLYSLITS